MTLRWLEGFERGRNSDIMARMYDVSTGGPFSGVDSRRGSAFDGGQSNTAILRTPELTSPDQNTWVVGFAFIVGSGVELNSSPAAVPYVAMRNASGEQLRLEIFNSGSGTSNGAGKPGPDYYKIRVMRGATEIARSDQQWVMDGDLTSGWVYFEFKSTINTGSGGSFEVRYHEQFKIRNQTVTWDNPVVSINTANQGAAGADRVEISWDTSTDNDSVAYDDIYILDSAGSSNNDFLGEVHIEGLTVQGDGDTTDWALADAVSLEDAWNEDAGSQSTVEDDKRATSDNVGDISLVTLSDLVDIQDTTIVGVQARLYGKMESTGTRDIQVMWRKTTGSPAQVGGEVLTVASTSFSGVSDIRENDPNTGSPWVIADINGLQVGAELDA